jgi:hypothetical protein
MARHHPHQFISQLTVKDQVGIWTEKAMDGTVRRVIFPNKRREPGLSSVLCQITFQFNPITWGS